MSVFLRKQNLQKGVYLSFIESTYDSNKKNTNQKVIRKIGYLDDLKKDYVDPIAYFSAEATKLSLESSIRYKENKIEPIPRETTVKNLGHFLVKNVFDKLDIKNAFTFIEYKRKFQYSLYDVFRFLIYSQIVSPSSKSHEWLNKGQYFEAFNFSDDQMYDAIKEIGENEELIKAMIQERLKRVIKIDTSKTYFDGTNVYFEIDKENEELKRGPEKNRRHDPIIGLGLLMDANGIPINYTLFPGNQSEQPELHKNVQDLKQKSEIAGRTIITADKGLNSGDNMYKAIQNGDGYIVGQKVRGSSQDNISFVLQDDENSPYRVVLNDDGEIVYKIKHEIGEFPIDITSPFNSTKVKINLKQKRIVFWSKDYSDKAKFEREKLIEKAKSIVACPNKYLKSTVGDAASYIKKIDYDKNGEIITSKLQIDDDAIKKAEELDGYYMIVTSEVDLEDEKIIEIYRGLWEIEESFSIFKGVLKVRPVFAKTLLGVHAHMLVCFTSLLILRLLQKKFLRRELTKEQIKEIENVNKRKTKNKINYKKVVEYPIKKIVEFIREFEVMELGNDYMPLKFTPLIPFVEERYAVKLDLKILSKDKIEKIFMAESQHKTKVIY